TDRSWSVVLAIPWDVLQEYANCPAPPRGGDQWRINFSRVEWDVEIRDGQYHKVPDRPEHNWVWSPQSAIDMHRPECWGYVQFVTEAPGQATFRPDPSAAAREYLMQVYHAQHAYKNRMGQWATSLEELAIPEPGAVQTLMQPTLCNTDEGFEATAIYLTADNTPHLLHVRADSRLWSTVVEAPQESLKTQSSTD
ncbi:MAG: hypothetical protein JWN98_1825, partial [Abditibacteriota bacterium]|nr:hypothetical protein [Abditibacteriota bacterium]